MKKVIGITGSIGSGKSYTRNQFKEIAKEKKIKARFIDVDEVRRKLLKDEKIDTIQLNQIIYHNEEEMKRYKQYINPKIKDYLKEQIDQNNGIIFIEWALLIEDELFDIVDSIIMIDCKPSIQMKRLERGELKKEEIIKRMNLQFSNKQKIEKIRKLRKEFFVLDTSDNPKKEKYEELLRKEGII